MAAAIAVVVLAAGTVGILASRRAGTEKAPGLDGPGAQTTGAPIPPGGRQAPPSGSELTLLGGRVVVAARPGWQGLESDDNSASVRLALRASGGRELLTTLTIATLSGPESFDAVLKLDKGTSFEVKGTDGTMRVTVQPGASARIVAGVDRPRGAFLVNLSIFALDNLELDAPTLRTLFTDQVAPALRFP